MPFFSDQYYYSAKNQSGEQLSLPAAEPFEVLPNVWTSRPADECWLWEGALTVAGYGLSWRDGRAQYVHRLSYERNVGPIPDGLEIDHLCEQRACFNFHHLQTATHRDNTLRSNSPSAINARKTHCPQGHPYDEANTYYPPGGNGRHRVCRKCAV